MKKAIIIGATSGIGRSLAQVLVENDYLVGITGRRLELMEQIKEENPQRYRTTALDVTDYSDAVSRLDQLVCDLGGVDLIVVSAGTGDINANLEFDVEKRTIDVNVTGFTAIVDWAFRLLEQQNNSGHLVAISSIAGLRGSAEAPSYNATKAYQINYLEGLRIRSAKQNTGITVTDIRPGFVDTDMAKGEGLFWVAPADRVARQIYRAIQKRRNIAYVTRRWGIIGMILKRMPYWLYRRL